MGHTRWPPKWHPTDSTLADWRPKCRPTLTHSCFPAFPLFPLTGCWCFMVAVAEGFSPQKTFSALKNWNAASRATKFFIFVDFWLRVLTENKVPVGFCFSISSFFFLPHSLLRWFPFSAHFWASVSLRPLWRFGLWVRTYLCGFHLFGHAASVFNNLISFVLPRGQFSSLIWLERNYSSSPILSPLIGGPLTP